MTILYVFLFLIAVVFIAKAYQFNKVSKARRQGIYPLKGMISPDDVIRLATSGERVLAIKAYRELNKCSLRQAKKTVDGIE